MRIILKVLLIFLLQLNIGSIAYSQDLNCAEAKRNAKFMKGVWIGEFTQYACGFNATYPMTIEINKVNGRKFSGFFIWDDSSNGLDSKSTLRGELRGNSILLFEDALVSGKEVILNGIYDPQVLEDGGRFSLKKMIPHLAEEDKPESQKRTVFVKENVSASSDYIMVKLWDSNKEDGDVITLRLNGQIALGNFEVKKEPHQIIIPLTEGENLIELYAENIGSIPPNTAAISIISGGKEITTLVLKSDMKSSEAISITKTKK